jgi:histidine triad (HIT) family protein
MMPVTECVFCQIASGEAPSHGVYEDDDVLAFLDLAQVNPGHVLIAPRQHVENLFDVSRRRAGHLFEVAHRISRAMLRAFTPDGLTIIQANGAAGGQTVFHLHLHLLPRYTGDAVSLSLPPTSPATEALTERAGRLQRALA